MSKFSTPARSLLLIASIPLILAISHDVYINYFSDSQKIREIKSLQINPHDFMMSDLGWVWQEYSANTMQTARDMTSETTWRANIDPILQEPTMLVALAPLGAGIVTLLFTFILGVWPFSRIGRARRESKTNYGVYKNARSKKK